MKFKIGDKVRHKEYGYGKIVYISKEGSEVPYAVQFETFNKNLHSLGISGAPEVKSGHGYWCCDNEIELIEEVPKNLIPQIAKMLGVEIGERFSLKEYPENYYILDAEIGLCDNRSDGKYDRNFVLGEIVVGKYTVRKLPKKPILTEDEKVILENLTKEYKWIARDKYKDKLILFSDKPRKREAIGLKEWVGYNSSKFYLFNHLFQFIKWEDEEPYNIEELLKE